MKKVWIQEWQESERGWGTRPDGFTAHAKKEDINKFLEEMRVQEKKIYGDSVPNEYSSPCGEPFEAELADELVKDLGANGIWLPSSWRPTKEMNARRVGGYRSL